MNHQQFLRKSAESLIFLKIGLFQLILHLQALASHKCTTFCPTTPLLIQLPALIWDSRAGWPKPWDPRPAGDTLAPNLRTPQVQPLWSFG